MAMEIWLSVCRLPCSPVSSGRCRCFIFIKNFHYQFFSNACCCFFFVSSFLESLPECSSCQFGVTACDHASVCGVSSSPRNATLQGAFTCWRTTTCGGLSSGEPRSADCSAWSSSLGLPTNDGYGGPPGARTANAVSGCSEPVSVVGEASSAGARCWGRVVN